MAFEKFIEKMAYFPAVFWVNKILNLYVNCHTEHINKRNPARFFKIGSVVPEIICRYLKKSHFEKNAFKVLTCNCVQLGVRTHFHLLHGVRVRIF